MPNETEYRCGREKRELPDEREDVRVHLIIHCAVIYRETPYFV